jgi:hypothetical protein
VPVPAVWQAIPAGSGADFGALADEDVKFTGRFFLRSGDVREIDEEVLEGAAGAGGGRGKKRSGEGKVKIQAAAVEMMSVEDALNASKKQKAGPAVEMMSIEDALKMSAAAATKKKGKK